MNLAFVVENWGGVEVEEGGRTSYIREGEQRTLFHVSRYHNTKHQQTPATYTTPTLSIDQSIVMSSWLAY